MDILKSVLENQTREFLLKLQALKTRKKNYNNIFSKNKQKKSGNFHYLFKSFKTKIFKKLHHVIFLI